MRRYAVEREDRRGWRFWRSNGPFVGADGVRISTERNHNGPSGGWPKRIGEEMLRQLRAKGELWITREGWRYKVLPVDGLPPSAPWTGASGWVLVIVRPCLYLSEIFHKDGVYASEPGARLARPDRQIVGVVVEMHRRTT
jgi:hypothetical protein